MTDFIISYGYFSMFTLGFLAATVLPVASEWLLVALVIAGRDPYLTVTAATAGNYAGSLTTYALGIFGSEFTVKRILRISDKQRKKAENFFSSYGQFSLLFAWMPIIGDPLCLVAGIMKIKLLNFSIFVITGKMLRYSVLAYLTVQGMS